MKNAEKLLLFISGLFILSKTDLGAKMINEVKKIIGIPDPIPLEKINPYVLNKIIYYCRLNDLDPEIALAVAMIESSFDPNKKNPSDPSYGLFALTPSLCYDYGLITNYKNPSQDEINKIYDIDNNCRIAIKHLKKLITLYPEEQAIQSYNVGITGYLEGKRNLFYWNKYQYYKNFYKKELEND